MTRIVSGQGTEVTLETRQARTGSYDQGAFTPMLPAKMVPRARTAIQRFRCSKPIALALYDGIIARGKTVFDYGCGHGADARYLRDKRIPAVGWDPHYQPAIPIKPADVVNLGYVLNVIEDQVERSEVLRKAFELSRVVVIVAVRVDSSLEDAEPFGDGRLTGSGTFQKIYEQTEFREYLAFVVGKLPYLVAPGIAYIFKDDGAEKRYLANRSFTRRLEYRTDLIEEFGRNTVARQYVRIANHLGLIPTAERVPAFCRSA
jgi:DNA phosphorothioation-associated putative methyltransferase